MFKLTHSYKSSKPTFIDSIRLRNFKAFQDTGTLPLKRITLLVGKNSAGKSSLIKSILGASQTSRQTSPDDSYFRLVGDYTNLGTYTDTVYENNPNSDFSIEFGVKDDDGKSYQLEYKFSKNEKSSLGTSLKGVKVHYDGNFILSGRKPKKKKDKVWNLSSPAKTELSYPKKSEIEIFDLAKPHTRADFFNWIKSRDDELREQGIENDEMKKPSLLQISTDDFQINADLVAKTPLKESFCLVSMALPNYTRLSVIQI